MAISITDLASMYEMVKTAPPSNARDSIVRGFASHVEYHKRLVINGHIYSWDEQAKAIKSELQSALKTKRPGKQDNKRLENLMSAIRTKQETIPIPNGVLSDSKPVLVLQGASLLNWLESAPAVWDSRPATFDPETSAKLLLRNTKNRPIAKSKLSIYSQDMKDGKFPATSSAIAFDTDGAMQNGQHRLQACAASGCTFPGTITKGLTPESFLFEDVHIKRSLADVLAIMKMRNYKELAGTLSHMDSYINTVKFMAGKGYRDSIPGMEGKYAQYSNLRSSMARGSHFHMLEILEAHPDLEESASRYAGHVRVLINSTVLAALHYIGSRADQTKTEAFLEKIVTGVGIEDGDPVGALIRAIQSATVSRSGMGSREKMVLATKALRYTLEGHKIQILKIQKTSIRDGKKVEAEGITTIEDLVPENLRIKF